MTDDITRRDVLRGLGGLALTGAIGCGKVELGAPGEPGEPGDPTADVEQSIDFGTCATATIAAIANREIVVSNVEAYAQKSVAAGQTIDFRVSSPVPYQLSIVRLGWDTDSTSRDWTLHTFPIQTNPSQQSIRPGSYIHVESAFNPTVALTQLTLECWVRPFREDSGGYWQGLMSQHTNPVGGVGQCGFGLFLTDANVPCCYFGNGGMFKDEWFLSAEDPLLTLEWNHVVAVFNAGTARLYVNGAEVVSAIGFPSAVTPGPAPLRLGAYGDATGTSFFLDGDLAMPVIYRRALSGSEVAARHAVLPPQVPVDAAVVGCWPLEEEHGSIVADVSGCGRHGTIVNRGTWMIGGPGFNAGAVGRFEDYDPDTDATRGHGLRLSSIDLYDCAWQCSVSYTLPSDCPPGVYVGRITYNTTARYDVTFVVRQSAIRPNAPVLVLCATNTWHAYNMPFQLHSFYDSHPWGQPSYFQGFEMPWTFSTSNFPDTGGTAGGADPYLTFPNSNPGYSHLVRAERFLHVWLEQNGYDYDVISDRDLHSNPSILSSYQTMFIVGHSEYWTKESWTAVRDHVASGGNLIAASGNTMFWRVSYDNSVIECRKLPESVGGRPSPGFGELYHEHDHQRGGLMREAGYPAWQVTGLECDGYDGTSFPYVVTDPMHALFQTPEPIAVQSGMQLGGMYGVGHEFDVTLDTLRTATFPGSTPPPPSPGDYTPSVLAQGRGSISFDYIGTSNPDTANLRVVSEIAEWVRSGGGRVLSVGSINASQTLHADEHMAALFRNALHANGVVLRLNVLAIGQDGHFEMRGFDGSAWTAGWEAHGAGFGANPPTGVQWAPNSLAAMAITSTGSFYYKYNVGDGWSAWNDFGGVFQGRPAAVGWGRNRLDLFAHAGDHLWWKAWDGSTFTGWIDLGGSVASDPAAISWEGIRRSVAVRGTAGNIQYRYNMDGNWVLQDMGSAPGTAGFAYAPTMATFGGSRIAVFAVDTAGRAWVKHWNTTSWYPSLTGWLDLGQAGLTGRVHVASWGRDNYTAFGVGSNGRLKAKHFNSSSWSPSQTQPWTDLGGSLVGEPTVVSYRGSRIAVFGVAPSGRVQHILWDGVTTNPAWQDLGGTMRHSPAVFRWVAT
jgi:hypothetical protein